MNADYNQPMSILAGDGNLKNSGTIVRGTVGGNLIWTEEQHRSKGNVLFADGHAEEWGKTKGNTLAISGDFVLPSLGDSSAGGLAGRGPGMGAAPPPSSPASPASQKPNTNSASGPVASANMPSTDSASSPAMAPARNQQNLQSKTVNQSVVATSNLIEAEVLLKTNAHVQILSMPTDDDLVMTASDRRTSKFLRHLMGGSYLLLLLLLLLWLAYKIRRWLRDRERKSRRKIL